MMKGYAPSCPSRTRAWRRAGARPWRLRIELAELCLQTLSELSNAPFETAWGSHGLEHCEALLRLLLPFGLLGLSEGGDDLALGFLVGSQAVDPSLQAGTVGPHLGERREVLERLLVVAGLGRRGGLALEALGGLLAQLGAEVGFGHDLAQGVRLLQQIEPRATALGVLGKPEGR